MASDPSKIAVALVRLCPGRIFKSFLRDPRFSSRNIKTCIWVDVCDIVQPSRHVSTLRKNIQKCYDTFRNKFHQIRTVYEKLDSIGEITVPNYAKDEDVNNNRKRLSSEGNEEDAAFHIDENVFEAEQATLRVTVEEKTDQMKTDCADCDLDTWLSNFSDLSRTEEPTSRASNPQIEQHTEDRSAHFAFQCNDRENEATSPILLNNVSGAAARSNESCLAQNNSTKAKRSKNVLYAEDEGFVIPKQFWTKFWSFERQLRKGWADAFVQYIKSVERYKCCVFKVNYHRCCEAKNNVEVHFYASMQCKNSSCTGFKFEVHEPITIPFKDVEIKVYRNKAIQHDGNEIHRRFIRGAQRDRYKNLLQVDKPSVVRSKKIQAVSLDVLESGNRDEAPSLTILQKISSENETTQDLDRDPLVHLQKRAELYRNDPKWYGSPVVGYIQDFFNRIAFTEKQILHLLSLTPKNRVFCYLDATGSIVSAVPHSNKRVFYYALVLPGCSRLDHEYGPMPLAEFLSNTHTVPQITYFLSTVHHAIKLYTTRKLVIKKIETDFSIALIAAVLKSFNDMTIFRYLHALYVLVTTDGSQLPGITLVHVCSSHMLKTVQRKCKEIFHNQEQHNFAAVLITKLIHSETMAAAAEAFTMVIVVFGLPYKVPVLESYVQEMKMGLRKETKEKKKKGKKSTAKEENEELMKKKEKLKEKKKNTTTEKNEKLTKENEKSMKENEKFTPGDNEGLTKEVNEGPTNEENEGLTKEVNEGLSKEENEGLAKEIERKTTKEEELLTENEKREALTTEIVEEVEDEDDPADVELKYDVELFDEADSGRKDSPFYQFFATIYDNVQSEKIDNASSEKNEWYCEEFVKYLLSFILPYYPIWSAVIIARLNLLRDSNATVENYFKIIKNLVLQKKLNISAPRFFLKVEQLLEGWLRERRYPLVTNRQKIGRVKRSATVAAHVDENLATEEFKQDPPKRRKENIYFPKSKYVLNQTGSLNSSSGQRNEVQDRSKILADIQEECSSILILEEGIRLDDSVQAANPNDPHPTVINIDNVEETGNITGIFAQDLDTRLLKETKYPPNFPHYRKNVGGYDLTPELFKRLMPDVWLDGEIINSFFFDLQVIADSNSWSLLTFDSYFSTKILKGEKSIGFTNWAKKVQPLQYDIWLLPVLVHDCHWTLLVVMLTHRVMIYFDSCHGLPPTILIDRICSFMSSSRVARRAKLTQWKSWQFSAPTDTPAQINDLGETTGNCGVHVCMWAYAIVSSSHARFDEKEMNGARRGIAKMLIEFPNSKKKNSERIATGERLFESYDSVPDIRNVLSVIPVIRSPPLGFESTSHFVASIKTLIEIAKE